MASKIEVLPGQTIPDLAMQASGSVEAMFTLAVLNGKSITDMLLVSSQISYDPTPYDSRVFNIYQNYSYKPASDITQVGEAVTQNEGVDYWTIGNDFIIS